MMKKFFSILSLALMFACCNFVFTSCGDDDDEELKEGIDRALLGAWEEVDEHDGWRDVIEFNSDGTYYATTMDLKDLNKNYLDDKFAYYMEKGTYTASNGVLTGTLTHEKDHKYNDKEWHEVKDFHVVCKYQIIDSKKLLFTATKTETGEEVTTEYTKCK